MIDRLLFELALRCYPRAFRDRFGVEMREHFSRSATGKAGILGTTVLHGVAERWAAVVRWCFWPNHRHHMYAPAGRHFMFWDTLRSDIRFALRQAIRSPLYTGLAVITLALGIGATTTVFTAVHGVLLRDLPYQAPERLVMIWSDNREERRPRNVVSPGNFADYRDMNQTLESVDYVLSFMISLVMKDQEGLGRVTAVRAGPHLFEILGREAMLGRVYVPGDRDVAVVSHGFWTRWLGADPRAIGRRVTFSGDETLEIIGVMPPDFVFPYASMFDQWAQPGAGTADLWVPMPFEGPRWIDGAGQPIRNTHALAVIGRMRPHVSLDDVRADLARIAAHLEETYPATNRHWGTTVVPLADQTVGRVRPALLMLLGGVSLILLMGTVNVANMVLARSVTRQRERAIRAALGAGRWRLVRQALAESLLLSLAGGLLGILWSYWGVRGLVALAPADFPRLASLGVDGRVLLFAVMVSVATGLLVAIIPAVTFRRTDVRAALQDQARGTTAARGGSRLRDGLLVLEVALAVMLTVAGGLLLHSFVRVVTADAGFASDALLTFQMNAPDRLTTPEARRAFYEDMFDRLARLPGVTMVGGTTRIPLASTSVTTSVHVEGATPGSPVPEAEFRRAMRDYFQAMNIPLRRGRYFTPGDGMSGVPVVIVNQTLARRLFGDSDPIGRRLQTGPTPSGAWATVIGVVGDIRHTSLESDPLPELYVNYAANPPVSPFIAVRTSGDPAALAEHVRAAMRQMDRTAAVYDLRTMEDVASESVAGRRFVMSLVTACTLLALLLAAVGVYGVVTLVVAQRVPEVGVRLALGATPGSVGRMVIGHALRLSAIGVGIGLLGAAALAPLLRSQLFGVTTSDPLTLLGAPVLLLAVTVLSAWWPARQAMKLDPVVAMRYD